ncbi:NACHT domain-containing protein [Myxococcus virescens]|nr:hypothetical protein [Myxococcus virescens]
MSSTNGPSLDEDQTINIGVGAHITAAAPDGPRYDRNLSSAERKSGNNGIWLCQSCSKLIDSDVQRYTIETLRKWKTDAVHRAQQAIARGRPLGSVKPPSELDESDRQFLDGLGLPSDDAVKTVGARLREASRSDVAAFQAARHWPARTILLTLSFVGDRSRAISLDGIAGLAALAEPVSIISPPGTGKSTTLVQLADSMLAGSGPVPLLIPLGEWSDRDDDFFDFVIRRNSFLGFRRAHFMQLAYHGMITLLLDGWNELSPQSRLRAIRDVSGMQRDYPLLGMVIGTRLQPARLAGPIVEIQPLSEVQQFELAAAVRGSEGLAIIDRAWRTNGVRELIATPLYLNALLALPPSGSFPQTKEAILRMFVREHESLPERAEILYRSALGFHTDMLVGLAVEASRTGSTVISGSNARRAISRITKSLVDDGQLATQPQPSEVLASLIDSHLLILSSDRDAHSVAFQHQQFQEWYAAEYVECLMLKASDGDASARKQLREEVLNWVSWEESALFACERLSRVDSAGARSVAFVIEETLGVDPIFSAEIVFRSSDETWGLVRERVLRFAECWHRTGKVDRALAFMLLTGRAEFSGHIWPIISHPDYQIRMSALRASHQLRPTVLGEDREVRLRSLPAEMRMEVLSELASNGDFDGMELAAALAAHDPAPEVVVAVVQSLEFRRADRHVNQILQTAQEAVWTALGNARYPETFADDVLNERLLQSREVARRSETCPLRLLARYLWDRPPDAATRVTEIIASPQFQIEGVNAQHILADAFDAFPDAVASGVIQRIVLGFPLPFRATSYLGNVPLVDHGPLVDTVLAPTTPDSHLQVGVAVVGSGIVGNLMDRLFELDEQREKTNRHDQALLDAHSRLRRAILETRQEAFIPALLLRAAQKQPHRIGLMAELLAQHGNRDSNRRPPIASEHRLALRHVLQQWGEVLFHAPAPVRYDCSRLALAAERLADPELSEPILRLLERDLTDWFAARSAYFSQPRGSMPGDVSTSYSNVYAQAFQSMRRDGAIAALMKGLTDMRWGLNAAGALLGIWILDHSPGKANRYSDWRDFSRHWPRQLERQQSVIPLPTSEFAERIFEVVREFGRESNSEAEQQYAINLAVTGLALPHGSKREIIDSLLVLPQPMASKLRLLVAVAKAGEILPSDLLFEGVVNLLTAARNQPWRLDASSGDLMGWLELFSFSDDPVKVLDAIALLPEYHRRPSQLERLCAALPYGNPDKSIEVLHQLAERDPAFEQHSGWLKAMIDLDTESSALAILSRLCDGRLGKINDLSLSAAMTVWAKKYPVLREVMIRQCEILPDGEARLVVERTLSELSDDVAFMALFGRCSAECRSVHGLLRQVRRLAIGTRPSEKWQGVYEEYGLPLVELRALLFGMTGTGDGRARVAEQCLIEIDECRDKYGRILEEPRHPDISAGRPWPLTVGF